MHVRYFAAACAAAGTEGEYLAVSGGDTIASLVTAILAVDRPAPPVGVPPLAKVLDRSSFLRNEVAVRAAASVQPGDVIDILPPFAGG
ncbi:MoaD/ThiS family protein [Arthrobacter sp. Rue61a]|uniref:MoaD/ThiS family protein n=1 Tax=Arthrobacter sp. Rue61a TaxID=1118963 RepID=UPI0005BBE2AF|nr:MoaD/ThiS family protein [Arthrobacter sp. Rue61a]